MITSKPAFLLAALLFGASFFPSCGHSNADSEKSDTTRSVTAAPPDNDPANNPSSADTMFQRDSSRHKRDTLHR